MLPQKRRSANYSTFGPPADLNGDGVADQWDRLIPLASRCEGMAVALADAATRQTNLDWWLGVLLILANAASTAGGLATTQNQSLAFAAAALSAGAGLLAALRQTLQPAQKAAHCRTAHRELLGIADRLGFVAAAAPDARPAEGAASFFERTEKEIDEAVARHDAVAEAIARWQGEG